MNLRKTILRVILWSLGLCALVGAAAILTGGDEIIIRTLLTAFATSCAAALFYPLSIMIDKTSVRPAGLFGMIVVIVEYVASMVLIWLFADTRYDDECAESIFAVGLICSAAFVFLLMLPKKTMRIAAWFGVAVAFLSLVVFLVAIWWPNGWDNRWDIWQTPWPLIGYGLLSAIALIGVGDRKHWRWLGIAACAVGFTVTVLEIWDHLNDNDFWRNVFMIASAIACVVAHANLVVRAPLRDGQRWLMWSTLAAGMLTAGCVCILVMLDSSSSTDALGRFAGAAGVVTACGSLALVVLARFNRGVNAEPGSAEFADINLTCPRCQRKQTLPLGGGRCSACDLRITIEVEEPRCGKCGYLLYQLTSDACPECGERVGVSTQSPRAPVHGTPASGEAEL